MTTPSGPGPLPNVAYKNPVQFQPLDFSGLQRGKLDFSKLLASIPQGQAHTIPNTDLAKSILAQMNPGDIPKSSGDNANHEYTLWNRITDLLGTGVDVTSSLATGFMKGHEASNDDNPFMDTLNSLGGALFEGGKALWRAPNTLNPFADKEAQKDRNDWSSFMLDYGPNADMYKHPEKYPQYREELPEMAKQDALKGVVLDVVGDPLNLFTGGTAGASKFKDVINGVSKERKAIAAAEGLEGASDASSAVKATEVPASAAKASEAPSGPNLDDLMRGKTTPFQGFGGLVQKASESGNTLNPKLAQIISETDSKLPAIQPYSVPPGLSRARSLVQTPDAIDPQAFNTMLSDVVKEGKPPVAPKQVANTVQEAAPPVSVPSNPNLVDLGNPEHLAKVSGTVLKNGLRVGGPNGWTDAVLKQLRNQFPETRFHNTAKYLLGLKNKGARIFHDLAQNPESRAKFNQVLQKTITDDHVATTPLKAGQIVDEVAKGNALADKLAEPVSSIPGLNPKEASIVQRLLEGIGKVRGIRHQVETGLFPGIRNAEHFQQAIDSGKNVKWSGPKQVNAWNDILQALAIKGKGRYTKALRMLRAMEDTLMGEGHTPYSASRSAHSIPLRLSDVIAKIGPEDFAKHPEYATTLLRSAFADPGSTVRGAKEAAEKAPDLKAKIDQAVEAAKAGSAIAEAPAVKAGVEAGDAMATAVNAAPISDARKAEGATIASKVAEDIGRSAGAGPASQKTAGAIVKGLHESDPVQSANSRAVAKAFTALREGKVEAGNSTAPAVTRAISQATGLPNPSRLGGTIGPNARGTQWLGARFAASYGLFGNGLTKLAQFLGPLFNPAFRNADLRTIYLEEAATSKATVAARARIWNDAARQYGKDPETWVDAMRAAQSHIPAPEGSNAQGLSKLILQHMENLFGSSGIRSTALADQTVAGRAQLLMKDLNRNLKRYGLGGFKFTNAAEVEDAMKVTQDYSKGIDWLKSWESWDIKDPMKFMMQISNAVEMTVREAKMLEEIAIRFGNASKTAAHTTPVAVDRLKGYYFSSDHAKQVEQFMKNLDELRKPGSKQMQLYDQVISKWKTAVTIYIPSHHIRNMIGDVYMNWLAGVDGVAAYSDAIKVMQSQRGRYADMDTLGELTSPNAMKKVLARARAVGSADVGLAMNPGAKSGNSVLFTMKNGQHVTNDMLYVSAYQRGILPGAHVVEDVPEGDATLFRMNFQPFGGKVRENLDKGIEYREHFIRLAQYIDELKKMPKGIPFEEATRLASQNVRKWHPDGMDLTTFERKVMRRVFPFYSWTRKALPLMVEGLVMNPGRSTAYARSMYAISALQGNQIGNGYDYGDPFPADQLFPDWIREKGIGPIMGSPGNYTIVNPSTPTMDLISQINAPGSSLGSMLTPSARIPMELMQGRQMSGAEIKDNTKYAISQTPGLNVAGRISNITDRHEDPGLNVPALLNTLTAGGVTNTGKYIKQGQFDLRDFLRKKYGNGG